MLVTDEEQDYLGGKLWYIFGITSRQIALLAVGQKVWTIRPSFAALPRDGRRHTFTTRT